MPDRSKLKLGDQIRILQVPEADLLQRKSEVEKGVEQAGWTANIIELIIAQHPHVVIDSFDEFGSPWFSCDIWVNGQLETHTLAIVENDSWEIA